MQTPKRVVGCAWNWNQYRSVDCFSCGVLFYKYKLIQFGYKQNFDNSPYLTKLTYKKRDLELGWIFLNGAD